MSLIRALYAFLGLADILPTGSMKTLKFAPHLVSKILSGEKTSTWRLFDDKNLSPDDELLFVNTETVSVFGTARITSVKTKTLGTLSDSDWEGHERYASEEEMYASYRGYYGDRVTPESKVKLITFTFSPYSLMDYLESAKSSLFRLEALQEYDIARESGMVAAYKDHDVIDDSKMKDWWNFIERKVAAGVRMERVRAVSIPLSDYVEMELEIHRRSAEKGDVIRVIPMTDEVFEKLFDKKDFWLIDDITVLRMEYNSGGHYLGFTVEENIQPYMDAKRQLLQASIPIENFVIPS